MSHFDKLQIFPCVFVKFSGFSISMFRKIIICENFLNALTIYPNYIKKTRVHFGVLHYYFSNESSWTLKMEQLLGRQPELRNKDSIHSFLFSFVYFQLLYLLLFFLLLG